MLPRTWNGSAEYAGGQPYRGYRYIVTLLLRQDERDLSGTWSEQDVGTGTAHSYSVSGHVDGATVELRYTKWDARYHLTGRVGEEADTRRTVLVGLGGNEDYSVKFSLAAVP